MKLRWLLPPLALMAVGGALWIKAHGRTVSPDLLLASARAHIARLPPANAVLKPPQEEAAKRERKAAARELDEGLVLATGPAQEDLRAELLEERSALLALEGLPELALADCRARLALGPDADTLARASELALWLGEPGIALELAMELVPLDAPRGHARAGRARVALADSPLAALESLARNTLAPSLAADATALAQRAAVFADDEQKSAAAMEELLELFPRLDERRRIGEWVREAADHLRAARQAFVASLSPTTTSAAVAGLQDLLLRAGARREAADLGTLALALPQLADPMPVLGRTSSALVDLGRVERARSLILDVKRRMGQALRPQALPSLALRDELEAWCTLLLELELWDELRAAAWELEKRAGADKAKDQYARFLAATADVRENQFALAQQTLDKLGTNPVPEHGLSVRVFMLRAEIARRQAQRTQERYSLLLATKNAPLDPPPELRAVVGLAWQRLSELQQQDGDLMSAEVSMTHALRCSSERAVELEPRWHELGKKSLATRGASSPYTLYTRARTLDENGRPAEALEDARSLLKQYPGLGPALELVSRAAERQRDFPLLISASLEALERGWPGNAPSGRLRTVPREYFLPQDRVRWLRLDPRGSLEAVVKNLLVKGDVQGAALAARGGPAQYQPEALLPLLARVELAAGAAQTASETLALLPAGSEVLRTCTGLSLRAALTSGRAEDLSAAVARVLASGEARDPELCAALDVLVGSGHGEEARAVLAWLEPQTPGFLPGLLLRQAAARLAAGATPASDEALERAVSLLEDGRPELGRLLLALERGADDDLEARSVLATPFASSPARKAALRALAGDAAAARTALAGRVPDGRDLLGELVAACLPELGAERAPDDPALSAFMLGDLGTQSALALGLASEVAPWSSWALARSARLDGASAADPWVRALRARSWLTLGEPARAAAELEGLELDPRLAWLHVEVERALGAGEERVLTAELAWLESRGATEDPALVVLRAARAERAGRPDEARGLLEAALQAASLKETPRKETPGPEKASPEKTRPETTSPTPDELELLEALARLEDTDGRRTRSLELYERLLTRLPPDPREPRVLALLDVLRHARDSGEISEARWWAEVEALESDRPQDPAPARELAVRSFKGVGTGEENGRARALQRLTRLRERTLSRPLESLRPGEALRWIELLSRYTPERAVFVAQEELRTDPADPSLWRASAQALVAAGRATEALKDLEALQRVAPELATARLVALTAFQLDNDRRRFLERLTGIERFDPEAHTDPELSFYGALAGSIGKDKAENLGRALALWNTRAEIGLARPEHGRALAMALHEGEQRGEALQVLAETHPLAESELARDVLATLGYLMRITPQPVRAEPKAPPAEGAKAEAAGPDDAPGNAPGPAPTDTPAKTDKATPADAPAPAAGNPKKAGGGKKAGGKGKAGGAPK
jgi:hypothetical protein